MPTPIAKPPLRPVLRKLTHADLRIPVATPAQPRIPIKGTDRLPADTSNADYSMTAALKFLQECRTHETIRGFHHYRSFLLSKYHELFGSYPPAGTPLEVCRARVCYRLQAEGHRLCKTKPSPSFVQNHRALMTFRDRDWFEGCTAEVQQVGTYLAQREGEVTMSSVKKVVKKVAKANGTAKKEQKRASGKRHLVYGKYTSCSIIRFLRNAKASKQAVSGIMNRLGANISPATVNTQFYNNLPPAEKIEGADQARLKALIPSSNGKERSPVKAVKKVVKLIKKVEAPANAAE